MISSVNKKKLVVLVSGWKGSGKTTTGSYLAKEHDFVDLSFAKALKDRVSSEYDIPRQLFDDEREKEKPMLRFPVLGTDAYATMVQGNLVGHMRTIDGEAPSQQTKLIDNKLYWKNKQLYWTPRALLILEGSTKRTFDPDHWMHVIVPLASESDRVIITDWRYPSEAAGIKDALEDHKVVTLRLTVDGKNPSTDASETSLDDYKFDHYIHNQKTGLNHLHAELDELVRQWLTEIEN